MGEMQRCQRYGFSIKALKNELERAFEDSHHFRKLSKGKKCTISFGCPFQKVCA